METANKALFKECQKILIELLDEHFPHDDKLDK
jgi:hypothetical protein